MFFSLVWETHSFSRHFFETKISVAVTSWMYKKWINGKNSHNERIKSIKHQEFSFNVKVSSEFFFYLFRFNVLSSDILRITSCLARKLWCSYFIHFHFISYRKDFDFHFFFISLFFFWLKQNEKVEWNGNEYNTMVDNFEVFLLVSPIKKLQQHKAEKYKKKS